MQENVGFVKDCYFCDAKQPEFRGNYGVVQKVKIAVRCLDISLIKGRENTSKTMRKSA
jgi:hypothetical protein